MKDPLLDKDFLLKLDKDRNRKVYVRLISLNFNEVPVAEINGRVTSGSINVDGSSSVRRTCSLSLVANELDINSYYWGLRTKFKCEIGIENRIDSSYPDVVYFPMGTYLITSFNTTRGLNNYTISISGKDKMCLLNGELGGTVTAISVDFGQLSEVQTDGSIVKTSLLLEDIIREAVHEYAHEPYHNIVINDLDEAALELIEYQGSDPLYLVIDNEISEVSQQTFDESHIFWALNDDGTVSEVAIGDLTDDQLDHRINLNFENADQPLKLYVSEEEALEESQTYYTVCKAEYGDVVGYRLTELTYAGDLISSVGDSITSMLDKIKTMLGDYEYFYNLDGQFVWQRVPTYTNVSWNNITQNEPGGEKYTENSAYTSSYSYSFENHNIVSSFQNTPNLLNIKNDYSIFGVRTTSGGAEVPVHLRYAIDKKPVYYKAYDGTVYYTEDLYEEEEFEAPKTNKITKSYFKKSYKPDFLDDDWWEAYDWAQYWSYIVSGDLNGNGVPTKVMSAYRTEYTTLDLNTLYNANSWSDWENHPLFLFDVQYEYFEYDSEGNEIGVNPTLGFTGHNPRAGNWNSTYPCGHKYNYILNKRNNNNTRIYFYKPQIPISDLVDNEEAQERIDEIEDTTISYLVDWREIIYRMASDYMKHGMEDKNNYEKVLSTLTESDIQKGLYYTKNFSYILATEYDSSETYYLYDSGDYIITNTITENTDFSISNYYIKKYNNTYSIAEEYNESETYYTYIDFLYRLRTYNANYYPTGVTGYEQYYTDMMSFWRDLYDLDYVGTYNVAGITKKQYYKNGSQYCWFKNQEEEEYISDTIYYTQNLYGVWQAHKTLTKNEFTANPSYYFLPVWGQDNSEDVDESTLEDDYTYYSSRIYYTFTTGEYYYADEQYPYWNKTIWTNPEKLDFWMDFLDTDGDLSQYSIPRIGDRPKAENNTDIKAVYYRETPNVIFVNTDEEKLELKVTKPGYTFISLNNNIDHLFNISSQGQSCKDKLNSLLYQYAVCAESISITAIPVYYLQPNTRIYVTDEESGINGEYIVSKIGYSLAYNGTMSIQATKAIDRIY